MWPPVVLTGGTNPTDVWDAVKTYKRFYIQGIITCLPCFTTLETWLVLLKVASDMNYYEAERKRAQWQCVLKKNKKPHRFKEMKAKHLWLIWKCHEFMDILKQGNLMSGLFF